MCAEAEQPVNMLHLHLINILQSAQIVINMVKGSNKNRAFD